MRDMFNVEIFFLLACKHFFQTLSAKTPLSTDLNSGYFTLSNKAVELSLIHI